MLQKDNSSGSLVEVHKMCTQDKIALQNMTPNFFICHFDFSR